MFLSILQHMGNGNERRDMEWPVCGALVCVFVGSGNRDSVSQLPCVRYSVFVKSRFKHTRQESKRAYVF